MQRHQCFLEIWKLVHGIDARKPDPSRLVDYKNGALAGPLERIAFPQYSVLPADGSVRPEIAGQQKSKGPISRSQAAAFMM